VEGATRANAATPEDLPGALAACAETEP
jgi:hypothetical protein